MTLPRSTSDGTAPVASGPNNYALMNDLESSDCGLRAFVRILVNASNTTAIVARGLLHTIFNVLFQLFLV